MPRGLFTQCVCLLLEASPDLTAVAKNLCGEVVGSLTPASHWAQGGPGWILDFGEGRLLLDLVDHPWPDEMGDPDTEPDLFGAWSLGCFGPGTYPGALARAVSQAWGMPDADSLVARHTGFLRLRTVYATDLDDPILEPDHDFVQELSDLLTCVERLATLPQVLAVFNPSGELLVSGQALEEGRRYNREHGLPDLDLLTNIRCYALEEGWSMMDVVGLEQFMLPDLESIFFEEAYDTNEVAGFLRNLSLYLLQNGQVFEDGDTTTGPGAINWQTQLMEQGMVAPPRRVLGWLPLDDREVPAGL